MLFERLIGNCQHFKSCFAKHPLKKSCAKRKSDSKCFCWRGDRMLERYGRADQVTATGANSVGKEFTVSMFVMEAMIRYEWREVQIVVERNGY